MTVILYALPVSNYCAKVAIALAYKGVPHQIVAPPGGYRSAEYRRIVPMGTMPALQDGDVVLSESEVINEYLEERFPEPPLLPRDPVRRARIRFLSRFHDLKLEPPVRALFPHLAPGARDERFVSERVTELQEQLDRVAAWSEPGPFLMTPHLSLADCGYPATLQLADLMLAAMGRQLRHDEKLKAWRAIVSVHPAVAPVLAAARDAVEAWIAGKLRS
ncbi:MAG: glutathione S-transferase family protein [Alphaproteobacteria bacterium]|nr:glutathione S-transferase family protein [Alphaproteobacteria bacterium]